MKKRFKSILGIMLVLALCLSFMPASAFAAPEATDTAEQADTISNEDITDEKSPEPKWEYSKVG